MTDSAAQLAGRLAELVDEHWRERNEPLLLSQLGAADQGEVGRLAKAHSNNLAAFVEHHAADRIRIVRGHANPLVLAAMPTNVVEDVQVDDLLQRARERAATGSPRYHPAFWAAFRVPLNECDRRFVSNRRPIRFEDRPANAEDYPAGWVEVERQYIADAACDVNGVQRLIADWLSATELDPGKYLADTSAAFGLPSNDLLGRLLVALDAEDLEQMTIPLNVIKKLRQQAI